MKSCGVSESSRKIDSVTVIFYLRTYIDFYT